MTKLILALAAGAFLAAPGIARPDPSPPPTGAEVSIPFANMRGGIRGFHTEDDDTVYVQDRQRNWYRAEIAGACIALPWAMRIAIDTRGSSYFDRSSALLVEGDRCQLISLTRSERPTRRGSHRAHASSK
jgi:hypothetical protein